MEHKHENHNGGGNGFLLGVIVGGVATLLFSTKKGREIVREIMDKGLEKFSELENELQKTEEEFEEIEGSDYVESEPIQAIPGETEKVKLEKEVRKEENSSPKAHHNSSTSHKEKVAARHFFKGSKNN